MESPKWTGRDYVEATLSVGVGVAAVAILIVAFDVPRKTIIGYGGGAWLVAVWVKMVLYHLVVVKLLHQRLGPVGLGAIQGTLSAFCELGAAALVFIYLLEEPSFWEVVGIGVGAGAVESVILPFIDPLKGTPIESDRARPFLLAPVLERVIAMGVHVTSRTLLYVTIASGQPFPGLIGFIEFAAADGVAYYGHVLKWDWDKPGILLRMYGFLALLVVVGAAVLWRVW